MSESLLVALDVEDEAAVLDWRSKADGAAAVSIGVGGGRIVFAPGSSRTTIDSVTFSRSLLSGESAAAIIGVVSDKPEPCFD